MGTVHVIGAGVAGLAAALWARKAGWDVAIHESAGQAGGRCRSYHDDTLDALIDNGNHLLLSGNWAAMEYLDALGAMAEMYVAPTAAVPFADVETGARWTVRPGPGRSPFWVFRDGRRVPGSSAWDYVRAIAVAWCGRQTVKSLFDTGRPIYRRFWEPFAVAVLNTEPESAAAKLLWPVLKETIGRGEQYSRPCVAAVGLSQAFVDPALAWFAGHDVQVAFNSRVRALDLAAGRVAGFDTSSGRIDLGADDHVILAVTAPVARDLIPGLDPPLEMRPIVNLHFKTGTPVDHGEGPPLLGLIGGTAQWLFFRDGIVSVTISAAVAEVDRSPSDLAAACWADIQKTVPALAKATMPEYRVVKEKRATFAQTPAALRKRPAAKTRWSNLLLAGDWTDTRLPATIEGAIRSGRAAARALDKAPTRKTGAGA